MTVTVALTSRGVGPPMDESENSERVRPLLSRHRRMVFCRTIRLPSGSVVTVWLVPSAEYGAPVTSRTLLGAGWPPDEGEGGQSGIAAPSCALTSTWPWPCASTP